MDTATLGPFAQYGAMGLVGGVLLLVVVGMFKTFVDNAIKSNAELQKQNFDMQLQTLTALNGIRTAVTEMKTELSTDIRELDHTVANMFNELSSVTGGSRGYAIGARPPKRGG